MLPIIGIALGVALVIIVGIVVVWRLTLGGMLRSAISSLIGLLFPNNIEVDPEAPIYPLEEPRISDMMHEQAEIQKGGVEVSSTPVAKGQVPQANIPARNNPAQYQPPYTDNPVIPDNPPVIIQPNNQAVAESANQNIVQPAQPLVEDNTFKNDDPIIDDQYIDPETPSADTLDAQVPESDSSPYGVRSAPHSPGRRLRDKRYRRNSS